MSWERDVSALCDEAGGVYEFVLVWPEKAVRLLRAAARGDAKALAYARVLEDYGGRIRGLRCDAPLCLTCDRLLTRKQLPAFIGLFHALRDDPSQCLVLGLCRACATRYGGREAIAEAMRLSLRDELSIPDLRVTPAPAGPARRA